MKERNASYEKYNQEFYQSMNIDPQAVKDFVVPTAKSRIEEYAEFVKNVSETQDPYMTLVVNTPCSYLWCWLGTLLPNFATNIGHNVYADTIDDSLFDNKLNADECSGHITTYINTLAPDTMDMAKTVMVFKKAMGYEIFNFNSTTSSHWA